MVTFADMAYRHRHGAFVSTKFRGGVEINGPAENAGLKNCCPWDFSTREVWDVALLRAQCLTLSSPVVPNGYTTKCSKPYWSNPPFIFFWRSGTLALSKPHQGCIQPDGRMQAVCRLHSSLVGLRLNTLKSYHELSARRKYIALITNIPWLWGSAGLKMPIHAHLYRRAILTRNKVGQTDLVFGVRWAFINWSVYARL